MAEQSAETSRYYFKECGCMYTVGQDKPWHVCPKHFAESPVASTKQSRGIFNRRPKPNTGSTVARLRWQVYAKRTEYCMHNPTTAPCALLPQPAIRQGGARYFWLYALRLEQGNYYVGMTGRANPYDRICQHGSFYGARWNLKHRPLEVLEIRDIGRTTEAEAERLEQVLTKAYMQLYGYQNVRGGKVTYTGRIYKLGPLILSGRWVHDMLGALLLMALGLYAVATQVP